ncbi:MAG: histidine phosphatase family protein [Actinomycetota bacterium]
MEDDRPLLYLVRHGETEWSRDHKHTSYTDLALTETGVQQSKEAGRRLAGHEFALVLASPMRRALQTCELTGLRDRVEITEDLKEWDYGDYEGLTTQEIRKQVPDWTVWTHGSLNGETAEQITARIDRVIACAANGAGDAVLFGHGHILRALTARWIGLEVAHGARFRLETATLSVLGYERDTRVVLSWNS